jgi:hypothetical protein
MGALAILFWEGDFLPKPLPPKAETLFPPALALTLRSLSDWAERKVKA